MELTLKIEEGYTEEKLEPIVSEGKTDLIEFTRDFLVRT